MRKRVAKECKILIRVREYENIEFRSSGEWDVEYSSEEERRQEERKCWEEVVEDIQTAISEWAGKLRHGASEAVDSFMEKSVDAVSRRK